MHEITKPHGLTGKPSNRICPGGIRSVQVGLRVTPEVAQSLQEAAAREGVSINEFVIRTLQGALDRAQEVSP